MKKTIGLSELIKRLQAEYLKGGETVEYDGTLLIPETGNTIILTTETQI
jgi:hypothetical protein